MKKYTSPSVEEIKLASMEAIAAEGEPEDGTGVVNPSGR